MKKATAETTLEITVACPYCLDLMDVTELTEKFNSGLEAKNISEKIKCTNPVCRKEFIVEEITY